MSDFHMNAVIFAGFCGHSEALCLIMTISSTDQCLVFGEGMYCEIRSDSVICALLITDKHLTFHRSVLNKLDLSEICYALCPEFVFFKFRFLIFCCFCMVFALYNSYCIFGVLSCNVVVF